MINNKSYNKRLLIMQTSDIFQVSRYQLSAEDKNFLKGAYDALIQQKNNKDLFIVHYLDLSALTDNGIITFQSGKETYTIQNVIERISDGQNELKALLNKISTEKKFPNTQGIITILKQGEQTLTEKELDTEFKVVVTEANSQYKKLAYSIADAYRFMCENSLSNNDKIVTEFYIPSVKTEAEKISNFNCDARLTRLARDSVCNLDDLLWAHGIINPNRQTELQTFFESKGIIEKKQEKIIPIVNNDTGKIPMFQSEYVNNDTGKIPMFQSEYVNNDVTKKYSVDPQSVIHEENEENSVIHKENEVAASEKAEPVTTVAIPYSFKLVNNNTLYTNYDGLERIAKFLTSIPKHLKNPELLLQVVAKHYKLNEESRTALKTMIQLLSSKSLSFSDIIRAQQNTPSKPVLAITDL